MGKYQTILIDPPWKQKAGVPLAGYKVVDGVQIWNRQVNITRDLAYPSMSIEEICSLPVNDLAADDAHLYVWCTNAYMPHVFEIIKKWGFKYSTTLVWAKNQMGGGLGGAYRINTEFLIFARKGNLKAKDTVGATWFNQKRVYENGYPKHSKKPYYFHKMIESVSPGPYLEMFAREERDGWDVFGNQVNNSIEIAI